MLDLEISGLCQIWMFLDLIPIIEEVLEAR